MMVVRVRGLMVYVLMSALFGVALAACGGGSGVQTTPIAVATAPGAGATPMPTSMPSSLLGPTGTASVTIALSVTAGTTSRARQSYFSAKTESIALYVTAVNGAKPANPIYTIVNTGTAGCTVTATTASCALSVAAPVGNDTFSIRTYAQPGGITQPLSIGTTTANVVLNQTTNLSVTFLPVVSFLTYTLSPSATTPLGTPATFTLTITAKDVGGSTISGTDPYYSPITVTSTDTNTHVTASPALPATLTAPGQTITFTYDGAGTAASYTFAMAVPGDLIGGIVMPTSIPITFTSSAQHLYVTQQSQNAVYVYDIGADGTLSTSPSRTIQGAATGLSSPSSLFVDALGAIYVTNMFTNVTVYAPGANGNVAPTNTLAAGQRPSFVGANGDYGYAIIANGSNNLQTVGLGSIYTTEVPNGAMPVTGTSFMVSDLALNSYSVPPGGGASPPDEACSGTDDIYDSTGVSGVACVPNPIAINGTDNPTAIFFPFQAGPVSVKFRPDGLLTVSNRQTYGGPGVNVVTYPAPVPPALGTGSTTPVYTLGGSNTGFQSPGAVAFDKLGNMYVADYGVASGQGAVRVFPMNANGNVAPTATIGGFTYLDGIAVGP